MSNRLKDGIDRVADYAGEKAGAARTAASEAIGGARESASSAGRRAAQGVDEAPIVALMGGIALGALAGVLLPRTRRETELLGPVGGKINAAAKEAVASAREAGFAKLDELGINKDNAREQVAKIVDAVKEGASSAGSAAAQSVTRKP